MTEISGGMTPKVGTAANDYTIFTTPPFPRTSGTAANDAVFGGKMMTCISPLTLIGLFIVSVLAVILLTGGKNND